MKNIFNITLLLLFAIPATIFATPCLKGKIIDRDTHNPVESADVILLDAGTERLEAEVFSDEKGFFSITDIKTGRYRLLIRLVGYELYERNVEVADAGKCHDAGVIELQSLEMGLAEVVVQADKRQIVYKLDKRIISGSNNLMSSGGTAVEVLENMPSIRVDADGDLTFRGSSGFMVYIDGVPSMFSGTQALRQIPAGLIEDIEIITVPSARNDASGEVGRINIITKKQAMDGFSGMANVSGSTALSNATDFLLLRKIGKAQWRLSGFWNMPVRKSRFTQDKTTVVDRIETTSYSEGPRQSISYRYGVNGGLDYAPGEKTTIGAGAEITYADNTRKGDLDYREERRLLSGVWTGAENINDFNSVDIYDIFATVFQGRMNFAHSFTKEENLTGSFSLAYQGDPVEYFQSDLYLCEGYRLQGHRAWEDEIRWTVRGKLDYVRPIGEKARFETGYQYDSYLEDGVYSMQFWNPNTHDFYWRDDIYNTFYFQRGVHSVYAIGSGSVNKLDVQAGARGEHTHQVLRSSIPGANRTFNRFELFPSLHAAWNMPRDQKITLAYSYRTNRPELFFMEPYITFRDYYTAEIGNPDIRPEYIHSYELSYTNKIGDQLLSATLFSRSRRDKIERLRVPYQAGVTLDSMANVGHDSSTGLELNGQFKLKPWWNLNLVGNAYYYKVENEYKTEGKDETSANYDITLNNLFTINRNTRVQLDGNFVGPSVTTQGRSGAFWFVNISLRRQLLPDLSGTLTFRDALNSARYRSDIQTASLSSFTRIRPDYPVISLTLSYTFNNYKASAGDSRDNRDLFEGTKH